MCNGDEDISEWFKGTNCDLENIRLTNRADADVSGKFDGNSITASIVFRNSSTHSFSA